MTPQQQIRLQELEADEILDQLTIEDRAELESLRASGGAAPERYDTPATELLIASTRGTQLPADLRNKLIAALPSRTALPTQSGSSGGLRALIAASLLLAATAGYFGFRLSQERRDGESRLLAVREENAALLKEAESRIATLDGDLARRAAREVELAQQLADATSSLDSARLRIAQIEAPIDPAELQQNRRKLLEVPGTIRVAWQPFDLPDAPAEQRSVSGDVAWNDELEHGFLRFVGLKPNDPNIEQYQVWVIDERGMEQKVSGGVFNASADGEVIVPIHPGIDVRKVALFAITIEEPGGTWVPSLKRRVVVAPRT